MIGSQFTPAQFEQALYNAKIRGERTAGVEVVIKALQAGKIEVVWASRNDPPISISTLKRMGRPVLVIIGDDDYAASGPATWKSIRLLMRWSRGVIIHGAGAEAEHYATAVEGAIALGRIVMVETASSFIGAWAVEADAKLWQVIAPRSGLHPLIPSLEDMH